jgi:hypothetical protein
MDTPEDVALSAAQAYATLAQDIRAAIDLLHTRSAEAHAAYVARRDRKPDLIRATWNDWEDYHKESSVLLGVWQRAEADYQLIKGMLG